MLKKIKEIFTWIASLFSSSKKESWRVVLLCLLAGTTFWVLNALNKNYNTKIDYPINFLVDNMDSLVVVEELPEKIEIDVSGGGWNLLRKTYWFNVNPVNIPLNNPTQVKYILGSSLVPLITEQVNEVSLNYVVTDTLFIDIEKRITKKVAVLVDSNQIDVNSPFRIVSDVLIEPDSIEFVGPSSLINKMSDSIVLALPTNISSDFSEEVSLNVPKSDLISYSPEVVNVSFDVARFARETNVVDVKPINFPDDSAFTLLDNKVEVIYTVQEDRIEDISDESFQILANFKNFEPADSTIDATLGLAPDYIIDLKVNPKKLRVRSNTP